jgi:hypothetical protein
MDFMTLFVVAAFIVLVAATKFLVAKLASDATARDVERARKEGRLPPKPWRHLLICS